MCMQLLPVQAYFGKIHIFIFSIPKHVFAVLSCEAQQLPDAVVQPPFHHHRSPTTIAQLMQDNVKDLSDCVAV